MRVGVHFRASAPVVGTNEHAFPGPAEDAQDLGGGVPGTAEPVRELGVELGCFADAKDEVLVAEDEPHSAGEHVEHSKPSCVRSAGVDCDTGMRIFQACTPPEAVSGSTVRPFTRRGFSWIRGSPTGGAPTRSSIGTRYNWASGSSSSRVARRRPGGF